MIALHIGVVILILTCLFFLAVSITANKMHKRELQARTRPNEALTQAVRVIDRVIAADDTLVFLPTAVRHDLETFISYYNKENK